MNLIISGLKLSVFHKNNREIFLVKLLKYVANQASYDPPIKSYEVCQKQKKSTAGKMAMRSMNVHFPMSLSYDCNDPGAYTITVSRRSKEFYRLGATLGSQY